MDAISNEEKLFIVQALACFEGVAQVVLVGAKAPVAFFAYPGLPSSMLPPDCQVIEPRPTAAIASSTSTQLMAASRK